VYVGFEVLTEVATKSSIFWDITPRSSLKEQGAEENIWIEER
jgi:hypothetical protein